MPAGRLRLLHTHLLVRGGARTPRRPFPPESYWKATLLNEALLQRLRREGGVGAFGARKSLPSVASDGPAASDDSIWGQLTTRGADESRAVGARLERWLAEREEWRAQDDMNVDASEVDADEAAKHRMEGDDSQAGRTRRSRRGALPLAVVAMPESNSELTARAVLSGLSLPPELRVPLDTSSGARLSIESWSADVVAGEGRAARLVFDPWAADDPVADVEARQDVALDLLELLGLDSSAFASMEGASWPRLLDVAECSATCGLLPHGELSPSTRRVLFTAPLRAARALVASHLDGEGVGLLAPLLRTLLTPSVRASRAATRERIRISVLPGFSMLCWAAALSLERAAIWPAPSMSYIVETLRDDATAEVYLRTWQFRDAWEVRPSWHLAQGPPRLCEVFDHIHPFVGVPLTAVDAAGFGDEAPLKANAAAPAASRV
mmetsp:Transcript_48674/g.141943  ORF Transcript_48674/g.141943 Transcript_48674/m.141943 type:complete len:437 (-) Transcript_48674:117-1427(-)